MGLTRFTPPWYFDSPVLPKSRFDTNDVKFASFAWTRWVSAMPAFSGALNSRSAGAFIIMRLPDGSVTRMGSATESMTRSSRSRSARTSASAARSFW